MSASITARIEQQLLERKKKFAFRQLQYHHNLIDFCSNDYLSLSRNEQLKITVEEKLHQLQPMLGATGSRSISGNTAFAEHLEKNLAAFYKAPAALLFNSGYDANVGLYACIAAKGDTLICDELIHASIIDGCRLSYANRFRFEHNNIESLEKKLKLATGNAFVVVESIYSMDGDEAPLIAIAALCKKYGAALCVDEAHSTGLYGKNGRGLVVQYGLENAVFARLHSFGKAMGCHGAVVVGSESLKNYLINYARSFIFTTALPIHSLMAIQQAHRYLQTIEEPMQTLKKYIHLFKINFQKLAVPDVYLIDSQSPIQCVVVAGSESVKKKSASLQSLGLDVRAITSPSVALGKERLRIILHNHNTEAELARLFTAFHTLLP